MKAAVVTKGFLLPAGADADQIEETIKECIEVTDKVRSVNSNSLRGQIVSFVVCGLYLL